MNKNDKNDGNEQKLGCSYFCQFCHFFNFCHYLNGSSIMTFVPSSSKSFFLTVSFSIVSVFPPISLMNFSTASRSKIKVSFPPEADQPLADIL